MSNLLIEYQHFEADYLRPQLQVKWANLVDNSALLLWWSSRLRAPCYKNSERMLQCQCNFSVLSSKVNQFQTLLQFFPRSLLSLLVSTCLYLSLLVSTCLYLSLLVSTCHHCFRLLSSAQCSAVLSGAELREWWQDPTDPAWSRLHSAKPRHGPPRGCLRETEKTSTTR